jgi:predicted phage tail protein/sugar lactone lactonase YvrE
LRESDSFAFGPSRQKEGKAARPPRARVRRDGGRLRRVAAAIVPAPFLLLITIVAFVVAWPSVAFILALRGIGASLAQSRSALGRVSNLRTGRVRVRPLHVAAKASRQLMTRRAPRRAPSPVRSKNSRRVSAAFAVTLAFLLLGGVVPVNAAANDITTVAGRPDSGDGGPATSALVHQPRDVAVDAAGNVYVADTSNHRIRRVSTTGAITTVAGNGTSGFSGDGGPATSAQLRFPEGVWVDAGGDLYIADTGNHRVRKVDTSGVISTVAGTGTAGFSGDGGPATAAQLNGPRDITTGGANLYIVDGLNHRIRRVTIAGTISTFAGNGVEGYAGDGGAATSARLNDPSGVAYDTVTSNLLVSDTDNHRVRVIGPSGNISTFIGTGAPGDTVHPRNKAQLDSPQRIALGSGGLYIADTGNDRVRFISFSGGNLDNAAGNGTAGFSGDGGSATSAQLRGPTGVAFNAGAFFVADTENHRVRRATFGGTISTYAGRNHFGGDGGAATDAALNRPYGLGTDNAGNLFIADTENHRVRRLSGGIITTIGGSGTPGFSGDGGSATSAQLNSPYDVAADPAGNVYVADTLNHRVRKIDAGGTITTVAGTGAPGFSGDGGPANLAQLHHPVGLELDAAGNLYIADFDNHRIRRVTPGGTITTVAGNGTGSYCGDGGSATAACLENPTDAEVDDDGSIYIADYGNSRVRKVTAGTIRTIAGNGSAFTSGDGGAATSAGVPSPTGMAVDGAGNVFIASSGGGRIRKVDVAGVITTVAGTGIYGFAGDGGPATSGELAFPARVHLDPAGNFYIADVFNNRVRMVEGLGALPGPTMGGTTPSSPANDNAPLVYGTAEPATTVTVYKDATCTGPVAATGTDAEFASPGLPVNVADDSTTTLYATATDGLGRTSACSMAGVTYIEDSTSPGTPTITLAPASPGSDTSPSWSFTTDAGAGAECELARGGTILTPYAPCTSPFTADLSGEPDGSYTFSVRATDAAGNAGTPSDDVYVLDSTQPGGPTITTSPATPSNDPDPTWEFTVEAGSTAECEFSYEGTVLEPFAPCSGPQTHNLTGDPDGTYTFRVQARDGAGNPSAAVSSTYVYDTNEPDIPTIGTVPSSPGSSTSPSWSFTVEAGSSAECELRRGGTVVSAWQSCASPKSYNLGGEPDGAYTFSVRAVDGAGNIGPTASDTYSLDTTGPDVSIDTSPASPDNASNATWAFSTEAGASAECELRNGQGVVSPWAPCAGSETYDLSGGSDGAYTFSVRATDEANNTGDPASSVYVLDRTAPVVSIDGGPAAVSSERNPEWDFSTEPGATTECELSNSTGVLQAFTPCTSPRSYDLSGQPDDTYTFSVRATDPAGNLGPVSSSGYYLDSTGPASSITASPTTPDNDTSPSWSFSAEAGAVTECELSSGGVVVSAYAPCTSPTSFDLSGQPDGPYTFSVRATDGSGNTGAPASDTYTLDTTAPGAPAITSGPASPSNLRAPSWSFTAEFGATTECELSRGGAVLSGWGSCSSPRSYSLDGQTDGDYTFRVRATDAVGNTGAPSQSSYTLDTTAPTVNVSSPDSPANDRTPSWDFSTEGGASTECQLSSGAGVLQPFAPCGSPVTYDLSGQPDGAYTVSVRGTDAAGNSSVTDSSAYVLDTAGPDTAIVAGQMSPGNATSPSWSFTTEAGASMECQLTRGSSEIHPFAPCDGSKTYDIAGEPDGDYTLTVRATDVAGNVGAAATDTYTLDRTAPAIPVITAGPASPGRGRTVEWSFSAEAGATTECELVRGATTLEPFANCTSPASFSLNGEPDGQYTFRVRALDEVGNLSAAASSSYTLDVTGPGVTITSAPASPGSQRNPTWSFTTEAGAATTCSLSNGTTQISPEALCVSPASFDLNGQPDGTYTLRVRAVDQLGNAGSAETSTYVLATTPPGGGGNGGDGKGDGNGPNEGGDPDPGVTTPVPDSTSPETEPAPEDAADDAVPAERDRKHHRTDKGKAETDEGQEIAPTEEEAREATAIANRQPGVLGEVFENVSTVVTGLLEEPAFPMILIGLVVTFLVLQNRLDRRDPKLALAPVYPDPHLYFNPQDQPQTGR